MPSMGGIPGSQPYRKPAELADAGLSEDERVFYFRLDRMRELGMHDALAQAVAGDPAIDCHKVRQMVENGCHPDLAAKIVL